MLDNLSLPGVDIAQGLERYSGETAYLEILRAWYVHTPELLKKLRGISPENLPEYAITIHGLKGSSYGILANDIGKRAQELEALAKADNFAGVSAENADFITTVEALLAAVEEVLQKAATGKKIKQKIAEPDPALLAKLMDAAKRYKATVMEDTLDEIDSYDYESGGELIPWLREQMDNLEYDEIYTRLEGMNLPPFNE